LDTRHRTIDTGNIGHKTQKDRHGKHWTEDTLLVSVFLCLVFNVTRVYRSVSCVRCFPFVSFCVLCPMLPVSIFLCLVSCVQCYTCLSPCVLCPMLPVSIFLCLVPNVTRVYLSVNWTQETERETLVTLDTRHRNIDTGIIGLMTQKDRHG
jgi:hypothetical protein